MDRVILILMLFSVVTGCTSRVVHEEQVAVSTRSEALNINIATATELEALPYIGRKTAEKIIQFREEHGPFRRVEHLMQIRGISERRFLEMRQFLKAE